MHIETELPDKKIHMVPPCPCGISRMDKVENINPIDQMYGRESRVYGAWDA
jgi:hypothetical protein